MSKAEKERILQAIARLTAESTASPEAARASLIRSGIYNAEGKLADEYKPRAAS